MKNGRTKSISTVAELVAGFGGTAAMAEWADVGMSCISNWKQQNYVPAGWHYRIFLEAQRRELTLSPTLFGGVKLDTAPRPSASRKTSARRSAAV